MLNCQPINEPGKPIFGAVTRRLGRQGMAAVAIRWRDIESITFGRHALDDVPAPRIIDVVGLIALEKSIRFMPAGIDIPRLVRQAASQRQHHCQNDRSSHDLMLLMRF